MFTIDPAAAYIVPMVHTLLPLRASTAQSLLIWFCAPHLVHYLDLLFELLPSQCDRK